MSDLAKVVVKIKKDTDGKGLANLKARIEAARGKGVRIGLPDGQTEKDGTPLTTVGFTHEFGAPQRGIPERSFMRSTLREQGGKYSAMLGAMAMLLTGVAAPILGVASYWRGKMQADPAIPTLNRG